MDSYSDDGAWEYFQTRARRDSRIKISQAPRQGIYAGFNNCISRAKGEYVYIATSDDTMSLSFLEVMVKTLDRHPECDLAHCKLKIIDEKGNKHSALVWDKFYCAAYFGKRIDQEHIRFAPHDGLLHCGLRTVYTSITQLLIRRSLFQRIDLFLTNYGSTADFEWDMRASLLANTIHIPRYLATWRVHPHQLTSLDALQSAKHMTQLLQMIDHAFKIARKIKPALLNKIDTKEIKYLYTKEKLQFEFKEQKNWNTRWITHLKRQQTHPELLTEFYRAEKDPKTRTRLLFHHRNRLPLAGKSWLNMDLKIISKIQAEE